MMKFMFVSIFSTCLIPFLLIALIQDMTKKRFVVLMFTSGLTLALYFLLATKWFHTIFRWFFEDNRLIFIGLISILGFATVRLVINRKNRSIMDDLRWSSSITQRQMEDSGIRYLNTAGWESGYSSSYHMVGRYKITKSGVPFHIIFLKNIPTMQPIVQDIRVTKGLTMSKLVFVVLEPVTEALMQVARSGGFNIIHYTDLSELESKVKTSLLQHK